MAHRLTQIATRTGDDGTTGLGDATVNGREIVIFNVRGEYFALLDRCPHEGASLCKAGPLTSLMESDTPGHYQTSRGGEIVRCPWHGWEFDLVTGACLTDKRRLKLYQVTEEDGTVFVTL